jgi:hypothetical protein
MVSRCCDLDGTVNSDEKYGPYKRRGTEIVMQRCTRLRLRHIILDWIQQPLADERPLRRRLFVEHAIHSVIEG